MSSWLWDDDGWPKSKDIRLVEERPVDDPASGDDAVDATKIPALRALFEDLKRGNDPLMQLSGFGWVDKGKQKNALKGTCGVLFVQSGPLAGHRVLVKPKHSLCFEHILYMWLMPKMREWNLSQLLEGRSPSAGYTLSVLLGSSLVHSIETKVEPSLLRRYTAQTQALGHMRGEINFSQTIASGMDPMYAPSVFSFSSLSVDCVENRLLKSALAEVLGKLRGDLQQTPLISRINRLIHHVFSNVSSHSVGAPELTFTALGSESLHYETALNIAKIILTGSKISGSQTRVNFKGFMFDTSKMFEEYIRSLLGKAVHSRFHVRGHEFTSSLQIETKLEKWDFFSRSGERVVQVDRSDDPMEPDFALTENGHESIIYALGEIKYQKLSDGKRLGLFQIQSYLFKSGCKNGIIVFLSASQKERFMQLKLGSEEQDCRLWIASLLVSHDLSKLKNDHNLIFFRKLEKEFEDKFNLSK